VASRQGRLIEHIINKVNQSTVFSKMLAKLIQPLKIFNTIKIVLPKRKTYICGSNQIISTMKKILYPILSAFLGMSTLTLNAQESGVRFELLSEPGVAQNGNTITESSTASNVVVNMKLINVSGAAMDLKWERVVLNMSNPSYTDQLCDNFYCYPTSDAGAFWLLGNTVNLAADAVTDFKPELVTGSHGGGSARMMYYVRNAANERIDSVEVIFTSTASIKNEADLSSSKVYPNPSNGQISIKDAPVNADLEITDMVGKVIFRTKLTGTNQSFDLSSNPDGVYFYTIKSADGSKSITKRLVLRK